MRTVRRDYLGIFLWAITWAAAILTAGAYGDQRHDARRAVADAAAVVVVGGLAALAVRAARRRRPPALAVAWIAARALSAARQNARRIETFESRQRGVLKVMELASGDTLTGCEADAPTDPRGLRLVETVETARLRVRGRGRAAS